MSRDPNFCDVNSPSEQSNMPPTSYFFGETCQNIHRERGKTTPGNNSNNNNDSGNCIHDKRETEITESSEIDLINARTENDNLTPSIILTSDDSEWKPCEQDSISSMESISNSPSPRTSYNSLLHWSINSPVDEKGK
ncbi:unnamed protein product [Trichobilharzia regenti]|nr:unnamed protein product [Trichobilharzia regenti]